MDDYFLKPSTRAQKQYEALRTCFIDGLSTKEVAAKFGCTYRAVTSLVADFRKAKREQPEEEGFFQVKKPGRKEMEQKRSIIRMVVELRKHDLSCRISKLFSTERG